MKKAAGVKSSNCVAGCSVRHKVLAVLALIGLFSCGLMLGLSVNKCAVVTPDAANATVPQLAQAQAPQQKPACEVIERILKERLYPESATAAGSHFDNAEIYTRLVEKGCPENADAFKAAALREIEIATALQPAEAMGEYETEIVIDAYKKADMQREAQMFFDKVRKLTDPAIDFILKMEQVINE